jgi:hypothetical protein
MPHPLSIFPGSEDETLNLRLWLGMLLPPFAGGINTIVGYIVSNYDCSMHNRHMALLVNGITLLLCATAAAIAASTRTRLEQFENDHSESLLHTRRFMLCVSYWFSFGFTLFILAGTTSTFLLHPCDL